MDQKEKLAVIKKGKSKFFNFLGLDGKKYSLTPRQKKFSEKFCEYSMSGIEAIRRSGYSYANEKVAAVLSSENLRKPNIIAYINIILEKYGLTDDNVDKQLLAVVNQHGDLGAKIRGIDIYYKKKGSYAAEKVEHNVNEKIEAALISLSKIIP